MKVRPRNVIIEAHQWFPERAVEGVRKIPATRVDQSKTRGIIFDRPERWVLDVGDGSHVDINFGDWVVTGVTGARFVVPPPAFDATYERVSK